MKNHMTHIGMFTSGMNNGCPVLTCPKDLEDGKQLMQHHKKRVLNENTEQV